MHIVLTKFIESLAMQKREHTLSDAALTSGGLTFSVTPSTASDAPTAFELTWPCPMDFSDGVYPMLLLLTVFGKTFDTVGLMGRMAPVIQQGGTYTEDIDGWHLTSRIANSKNHLSLTVA